MSHIICEYYHYYYGLGSVDYEGKYMYIGI